MRQIQEWIWERCGTATAPAARRDPLGIKAPSERVRSTGTALIGGRGCDTKRRENPAAPRLGAQAQPRVSAPLGLSLRSLQHRPAAARPGTSLRWRCWTCPAVGKPLPAGAAFFGRGRIQRRAAGRAAGSARRGPNPPDSAAARPAAPSLPRSRRRDPGPRIPRRPGRHQGDRSPWPVSARRDVTSLSDSVAARGSSSGSGPGWRQSGGCRSGGRLSCQDGQMLLHVFSPLSVRGRDGTFASFLSPLGKRKDGSGDRACAAACRWGRWRMRFPGGGEGSDARLVCSVLISPSPGTGLSVAFSCTAVPYISLSCSLNGRVGCS